MLASGSSWISSHNLWNIIRAKIGATHSNNWQKQIKYRCYSHHIPWSQQGVSESSKQHWDNYESRHAHQFIFDNQPMLETYITGIREASIALQTPIPIYRVCCLYFYFLKKKGVTLRSNIYIYIYLVVYFLLLFHRPQGCTHCLKFSSIYYWNKPLNCFLHEPPFFPSIGTVSHLRFFP